MKPEYEPLELPRRIILYSFFAVGVIYLYWRTGTFHPDHPVFSRLLYAAEVFGFLTALLNAFMTWRLTVRVSPTPSSGLSVDVFIPTYNEDLAIVRRTVLAAKAMDYPHETWVLDDGNRPEVRTLAAELGVRYLARADNTHAKAGNLNHALRHSRADFIATFDADHAPRRDFLQKTLGFFADERVAFVQTPQDFYNLDSFQNRTDERARRAWSEQSLFFRIIQRGKDYWNSAFYCGSCAVIRRQALDDIGGFATGTVTEDIHTSLRLHKRGWRSVYLPESLAYGIAPAKLEPFLKQRIRWGIGAMNVWRREGILTARGLTLPQRLSYLATALAYFDGWQKALFYIAPVLVLTTGMMPISVEGGEFLMYFVPYYLLNFLAFEEIARGYGRSLLIEQYNLSRFAAFAWSTLGLLFRKRRFVVTDKRLSTATRGHLWLAPQYLVFTFNAIAIPTGLILYTLYGHLPTEGMWANVFWASVNTWLAWSVLRFSALRERNRRHEYRFQVPIAALVEGMPVTVDDISPEGLRLYGALSVGGVGQRLRASLALPDGPLACKLEVRSVGARMGSVGCRFVEMPEAELQRLEAFLYGSDEQWWLSGYREQAPTPLQRIGLVPLPRREWLPPDHWNAARVTLGEPAASPVLALVGPEADTGNWLVLSHIPLPEGEQARLEVHGRMTTHLLRVRLHQVDMDVRGLRLYRSQPVEKNEKIETTTTYARAA